MSYLLYSCLFTYRGSNNVLNYELHAGCLNSGSNCLPFASTWVHPRFSYGVEVAHLFSFLCCVVFCCLRPMSYVPNVYALTILDNPIVFSDV